MRVRRYQDSFEAPLEPSRPKVRFQDARIPRMSQTHPLYHLSRRQRSNSLYVEIKAIWLRGVIEHISWNWCNFFSRVVTKGPFSTFVCFEPVCGMSKFVVRIIFESNRSARRPLGMFFGDTLYDDKHSYAWPDWVHIYLSSNALEFELLPSP